MLIPYTRYVLESGSHITGRMLTVVKVGVKRSREA